MAIEHFSHKGLRELFAGAKTGRIDTRLHGKLVDMMDVLDAATDPKDLMGVGGFHALRGDRKGEYAMTVTGNWRLTFSFERGAVRNVNLVEYHGRCGGNDRDQEKSPPNIAGKNT
jgi:proteic killer suppression protein